MNRRETQEEMLKKNAEEKWSHNQHKDMRNAPRFVAPLGTMPLMNDASGSNSNNTQGNISDNLNPDVHTNHVTRTHSSNKPPLAPVREQDRYMPTANVLRIIRRAIPSNGKVSEEAKETMQECVSKFISFITSEANENCQKECRKTVSAEDIIVALSKLGFDHYVEPLSMYLKKYRENEADPRLPRRSAGNMNFEAAVASDANVLPTYSVVDPPTSMFTSPAGQSLYTAHVNDGSGPSVALGTGGGPSESEGVGPSQPPQVGQYFYHPYGHYRN